MKTVPGQETTQELKRGSNGEETTILLPKEQLKKELGIDTASFTATELEQEYYRRSVRKEEDTEKFLFRKIFNKGGMGTIFSVLDRDLHRMLAMKVMLPSGKNNLDTVESFVKEAKVTGFLEHPNIIPVHEFGLLPETGFFFTMKLAQGETLRDIICQMRRGHPEYLETYNTYLLLTIFRKVCDAVSYAHSMGIIHQDIKPNNIIVGRYGQVFLIDWGTAKIATHLQKEPDPVKRDFLAAMGAHARPQPEDSVRVQGSPAYMSPEQAKGASHLSDQRSDIFLLGSTLYAMFTLQLPYMGKSTRAVMQKARLRKLIPPQLRSPDRQIPEEICRVIMKAMAYKQEERYQTVEAFAQDIDQLIAGKWRQQKLKVFRTGAMLMREGNTGTEAYLILSGSVLVTKEMSGTKVVLGTYQQGEIIGEMSLISDKPRSATIQALEKTTVAVLTKQLLAEHLKKLPPYMEKIVSELTNRLQQTDAMIHPHLTSDCTGVVLKHLRLIFKDKSDQPHTLTLPFREVVEEIAQDLGLPQEKVRNVLAQAITLRLIVKQDDDTLRISDMHQLTLHSYQNE